jgi:hypothetical protein
MLGFLDPAVCAPRISHTFYQGEETQRARIVEVYTDSESEFDNEQLTTDSDSADETYIIEQMDMQTNGTTPHKIYLAVPKQFSAESQEPLVQAADRGQTSTRATRREVFDGVHVSGRDKSKTQALKDLAKDPPPGIKKTPAEAGPKAIKPQERVPDLIPVDARKVRFDPTVRDIEMEDVNIKPAVSGQKSDKKKSKGDAEPNEKQAETPKVGSRQTGLAGTVDRADILKRILDTPITMSIREVMETAKDIRTDFQELIKLKNVRAVYLGKSSSHPLIANLDWPRSEGILIKIEMETGGRTVIAIVDTGSQLDVVRADTAALTLGRVVDMTRITSMNDANGGRGQLRGWIEDVEFNCGGAVTRTDLWVSQKAPFELLLGRPWQRGNLVSIDEREEGTYLIFKDRQTKRPRYELLAIPQEGTSQPSQTYGAAQYESFMLLNGRTSMAELPQKQNSVDPALRGLAENEGIEHEEFSLPKQVEQKNGSSVRHQGTQLLAEAAQLVRVWISVFSLMGGWIMVVLESRLRQHYLAGEYKEREDENEENIPSISHVMSIQPVTDPLSPAVPVLPAGGYEPIEFLPRNSLHRTGRVDREISTQSPEEAISAAVHDQWENFLSRRPIPVNPIFAAAPQATYHGAQETENGNTIHRLTTLNGMWFLTDHDGRPWRISGHSHSVIEQGPVFTDAPWIGPDGRIRDAPFPTPARLAPAMTPFGPNENPPLEYPFRGTLTPPPLPDEVARLPPEITGIRSSATQTRANSHIVEETQQPGARSLVSGLDEIRSDVNVSAFEEEESVSVSKETTEARKWYLPVRIQTDPSEISRKTSIADPHERTLAWQQEVERVTREEAEQYPDPQDRERARMEERLRMMQEATDRFEAIYAAKKAEYDQRVASGEIIERTYTNNVPADA